MRAEILSVGTELLIGDIVNTNAAFLAGELADLGIDSYYQQVVGDNPKRLLHALDIAISRSDVVITTGGLGPTQDDLTKETVANYFGVPLEFHQASWDHLVRLLALRGRTALQSQRRQAMMPTGATIFPNDYGTANGVGVEAEVDNSPKLVIMLPGPPREMRAMFTEYVRPFLRSQGNGVLVSHNLHLFGIGESQVEAELDRALLDAANPTVALYAADTQVRLRVSALGTDLHDAESLLAPIVERLREQFAEYVYGVDTDSLAATLVARLKSAGLTIATAESCTGGLVASEITTVPGSSEVFGYGVVTYANSAKAEILGVRHGTLSQFGAVSEETAIEMAEGVRTLSGADIGVAITGIAGPDGGTPVKPVGLVWLGIASNRGVRTLELHLNRGFQDARDHIRRLATTHALQEALREATERASSRRAYRLPT
ncbi:MAG: competence/damage-inducible protein A [Promicromonosporaceae bacterium]|nr:competence/damage-inducible protein A [Promicromonosporaceae bacterium]